MKFILMFLGGIILSSSGIMRGIGYDNVLCVVVSVIGWILLNIAVRKDD